MKIRTSKLESTIYIIYCVLSLGLLAVLRVCISIGIRKALDNED